jgi:geranylgeranyl pyrophosphate synthase
MQSKPNKELGTNEKLIKKILKILKHKGSKSLEIARISILRENIQSNEARGALRYYAENFLEFTPAAFLTLACEAVGGDAENTTLVGAAITLFVGAIDIHDDVIDQSEIKDGRPTVFGRFGKEVALLAGDALLFKGFSLFQKAAQIIQPEKMVNIAEVIQTAFFEMGDAHALEVGLKGRLDVPPEEYLQMVKKKVANVEAYVKIGAVIGNGTQDEIEALSKYGRIWGVLSTIRNDFVDLFVRDELKNRMLNEILPLPILCSFEDSQMKRKILKILSEERITEFDLEIILNMALGTKQVENLKKMMQNLIDEAKSYLTTLQKSEATSILEKFISSMLEGL